MRTVLEARGVCKSFGGLSAVDGVDMTVGEGELHAIIGPNGAGKTTFLSLLSGELRADRGQIRLLGEDVAGLAMHERARRGLARTFQVTSVFEDLSVLDNMLLAAQARERHAYRFWTPAAADLALRDEALAGLRDVGLAERAAAAAAILSHGERRALELAMAVAARPAILLLDEPMAGIGTKEAGQVVERLRGFKGRLTIVLIEHDMNAVFALADRITVLAQGRAIACGAPAAISADPAVQSVYLGDGAEY
ncbi:ABC transporter ATP-binding protein [Pigmentiphaga soli]|uniref:ABC transporter ATP-binding protein n=1 Tax=Pigmentiphaga soli TaxID=1007095 RepID=A0ABP8H198_9BURK